MSFEPRKREDIEKDNLNIEFGLNTSLEVEGITVSEDLISRTMNAIRLDEANNPDAYKDKVDNKSFVFFRHARTFVTIAAAVLILAVGFNALRALSPIGMKSDMSGTQNSVSYDDAGAVENYTSSESQTKDDSADYAEQGYFQEEFKEDAKIAGILDEEDTDGVNIDKDKSLDMLIEDKSDEEDSGVDERMTTSGQYMFAFADITVIGPGEVNAITISSKTTGETIDILSQAQIDRFFSLMEKHYFTQATTEDDSATLYVVCLASEDGDSQLLIGENTITVDNTQNDITSHSIFNAAEHSILIKDIMDLSVE